MKRISVFLIAAAYAAISAQNAGLSEKDIPKKVIATRNAKAKVLKHKDTVWSKNEAGEFVAERKIGGNAAEETPPDQTITARFKEDGTWIQTETLSSPYNDKVKGRMIPGNVQKACKKLGEPMIRPPSSGSFNRARIGSKSSGTGVGDQPAIFNPPRSSSSVRIRGSTSAAAWSAVRTAVAVVFPARGLHAIPSNSSRGLLAAGASAAGAVVLQAAAVAAPARLRNERRSREEFMRTGTLAEVAPCAAALSGRMGRNGDPVSGTDPGAAIATERESVVSRFSARLDLRLRVDAGRRRDDG